MKKILNSYKSLFILFLFLIVSFGANVTLAEASCSLGSASVSPTTAKAGDVVTISWNVDGTCNRTEIYLNGWPTSSLLVNKPTTRPGGYSYQRTLPNPFYGEFYNLTLFGDCSGYNGFYATCGSAGLSVLAGDTPPEFPAFTPSVTLTPSTQTINSGQSATLTWSSNLTSCSATTPTGWTSSTASSGSGTVSPTQTTTYSISCITPAGTGTCSGTVVGSKDGTTVPGPYEGQSCSQFTTKALCTQGWPTHGCQWNGPSGSTSSTASASATVTVTTVQTPPDACGSGSGSTPQLNEPTTNPSACNPGVYANSPADTTTPGAQSWNWSCGAVTSCSAPKYGCRTTNDINYSLPQYGANGPNNNWGCANKCSITTDTNYNTAPCAGTCANGAPVGTYPTCNVPPPPPPAGPYTITASSGANGTVTPAGVTTKSSGTSQTYTITPSANYSRSTVLVDGVNNTTAVSTGTYTFSNITANHTISATFSAVPPPPPPATTATIKVVSNVSTGWCINNANCVTNSTTKTYTVTPGATGSSYTIVGDTVANYSGPVITNDVTGNSSTFTLFPGDTGTFSLSYTADGGVGCVGCPAGFNYSLSNSGMGNPAPGQVTITKTLLSGTPQTIWLTVSSNIAGLQSNISGQNCALSCSSVISFVVPPSTPNGTYPITVTGDPGNKTTNFNLVVSGGGGGGSLLDVSCSSSPVGQAKVGDPIAWIANVSGGNPPYVYKWFGDSIPSNPPPTFNQNGTVNQYNIAYTTTGTKGAQVEVTDSSQTALRKECVRSVIQIKVNPTFKEQ
ncbi:MAG: hypothetical protein WAV25_00235 [Minisyncoccia bacterium]